MTTTLSRTARGERVPTAVERARLPRLDDRVLGWVGALAVTALAFGLRLWHLGFPNKFLFDETYYAKDAWSLLQHGYVRGYVEDANDLIVEGKLDGLFTEDPSMIVHPEVGKWLIALSEGVFGMDSFGWRFASVVAGSLMVLLVIRLTRRLTGSTLLGLTAGLLMCFDGLHFVLSRLALLDIFQACFVLGAVSCMVADRDWMRRRLADHVERLDVPQLPPQSWGPRLLWRPWLLAAGVWWGLAVGTKWSSLFVLAAFGLLLWAWSAGARRSFGVDRSVLKAAVLDAAPAVAYVVLLPALIYVVSWTGWLLHAEAYEATLSNTQYGPYWGSYIETDAHGFLPELWQSLRSLWHYHHDVFSFHTGFLDDSEHVYQSDPLGWSILNRPVGVDAQLDIAPGEQGCTAAAGSTCMRQVLLLGTPVLWWAGTVALAWAVVAWVGRRDWRYGLVVVGAASAWLPWLRYDDRPIFSYYAIVMEPFLVIGLVLLLGELVGRAHPATLRRRLGVAAAGIVVVAVALNFAYFWPIYTDELITRGEWVQRMWFHRWI